MAVALSLADIGKNAGDPSSSTVAFTTSQAVPAGDLILVEVGWFDNTNTLSSVADNGAGGSLGWTIAKQGKAGSTADNTALVWARAPSGLASGTTITATFSAATVAREIGGSTWSGVLQSGNPIGNTGGPTAVTPANAAWASASVSISAGSALVATCYNETGNFTNTPTQSEAHEIPNAASPTSQVTCYRVGDTPGSYTVAGTWSTAAVSGNVVIELLAEPTSVAVLPLAPIPFLIRRALPFGPPFRAPPPMAPLSPDAGTVVQLDIATEADSALALGQNLKSITLNIATETDAALATSVLKSLQLGIAAEVDSALAIAGLARMVQLGIATETDAALALTVAKLTQLGIATETDTALALTAAKLFQLGVATEVDSALALSVQKLVQLGIATEVDSALALVTGQIIQLGIATESDTALALTTAKLAQLGIATEDDLALAVTAAKAVQLGIASETDTALALSGMSRLVFLGIATETDVALPVTVDGGAVALDPHLFDGFMRDGDRDGPLIVVTEANAQPPLEMHEGFLRDARYYLVVTESTGPGAALIDGFLRTISP